MMISVRVSEAELGAIRRAADVLGETVSDWARGVLMSGVGKFEVCRAGGADCEGGVAGVEVEEEVL